MTHLGASRLVVRPSGVVLHTLEVKAIILAQGRQMAVRLTPRHVDVQAGRALGGNTLEVDAVERVFRFGRGAGAAAGVATMAAWTVITAGSARRLAFVCWPDTLLARPAWQGVFGRAVWAL